MRIYCTNMFTVKGMVYTKACEFAPGMITIEDDRIKEVSLCNILELNEKEQKQYLIPGLVDVHFHGAAGYDFCDGTREAFHAIEQYENAHGITTICPATMTLPVQQIRDIVKEAAACDLKTLRGIHLEGPFIAKEKKGAQKEEYIIPADAELIRMLQESADGLIKIISIAPETEGAIACIKELKDRFCFSVAHTMADYDTAYQAFSAGARHVTHLYNAMPVSSHRNPSVLGAAADSEHVDVELICDGIHVHPSIIRNTFRIFPDDRILLISDSMRAVGLEDGNYTLGGQEVIVKGALATLLDGTIAGSVTNLFDCMRNAVFAGIPKEKAIKAATMNPARSIGVEKEVGSLEPGKKADILFVDEKLNLNKVMIHGEILS